MSQRIEGSVRASSSGIVIGRVQKLLAGRKPIPERHLTADDIENEQQRLAHAVQIALEGMDAEIAHLAHLENQEPTFILEAHRMMLLDPELIDKSQGLIAHERINAEWALRRQLDAIVGVFDDVEDEYLKSKKNDVEQVGARLMQCLMGASTQLHTMLEHESIIAVAEDFSPAEIIAMWRMGVAGMICAQGGMNAHSIIVARGVGLPALIGARGLLEQVEDDDVLVLDAERECWSIHLSAKEIEQYKRFIYAMDIVRDGFKPFATKRSQSRDGYTGMKLMGNLELCEEAAQGMEIGIEGVGLFRTEFLFMQDETLPSEQRQYQEYARVVDMMAGKSVTFRLLDIGGDKPVLFQKVIGNEYHGENPAMGVRGVRLLLQCPEILQVQLRALLRASRHGPINILVPMVTTSQEMEDVREILDDCCEEMGIQDAIALGCMIEVPASAIMANELAKVSDFFSIGSNDLIQYSLAADRSDEAMAHIYTANHPAILRLIKQAVQAAKQADIPIAVCGELAANPAWTEHFLNLGINSLSMSLNNVLMIRRHLSKLTYQPDLCL